MKKRSDSPRYSFRARWGITTGIPRQEPPPPKKEPNSESDYDSEEEPWVPFQDHPYPQQSHDSQLAQDGDDMEVLVKSLQQQRRVEKPEKMEKQVQNVAVQQLKRTQLKQAKAMNALSNGHSSLVSRQPTSAVEPNSFPLASMREE